MLAEFPLFTIGAIGFFTYLAACISPNVRAWTSDKFSLTPPSSGWVRPELDTVRGAAALFVAFYHTWQWLMPVNDRVAEIIPFIKEGDKGVPIFASLSGLLIYKSLGGSLDYLRLRSYFHRRILRIYPLFFAVTLAATAIGQMRSDSTLLHGIVSEFLMLQVFGFPYRVVLPTWSLHVEVIFYVFLPAIVVICGRRTSFAAIIILLATLFVGHSASRSFQLIPFFCVGMLALDFGQKSAIFRSAAFANGTAVIGLAFLVFDIGWNPDVSTTNFPFDPRRGPLLCLGLFLFLSAISSGELRISPLRWAPFRMVGVISYSIYLWHTVLLTADVNWVSVDGFGKLHRSLPPGTAPESSLLFLGILVPAILFWAGISYLLIERPFLMFAHKRRSYRKIEQNQNAT